MSSSSRMYPDGTPRTTGRGHPGTVVPVGTNSRGPGASRVRDSDRDWLLASAQRHDPVDPPGDLPVPEVGLCLEFRPGRPDDIGADADRLAAATGRRRLYGPAAHAVRPRDRHGVFARRLDAAGVCDVVCPAARRCGAARRGIVHLPSGGVPHRADGLRRPARARPGAVPGGRQRGVRHRAVDRRVPDRPTGPVEHRVVFASGGGRDRGALEDRGLVRDTAVSHGTTRGPVLRLSGIRAACPAGGSAGPSRSSAR